MAGGYLFLSRNQAPAWLRLYVLLSWVLAIHWQKDYYKLLQFLLAILFGLSLTTIR